MSAPTVENIKGAIETQKGDWKSVVSLLLAALIFAGGLTWMITGYVVKGADQTIRTNTEKIIALESKQTAYEIQMRSLDKRQDEVLVEIRSVSSRIGSLSESQARLEGYLTGTKK